MSASSTRVGVATVVVVALALAGVFGWSHLKPVPDRSVQLAASAPDKPTNGTVPASRPSSTPAGSVPTETGARAETDAKAETGVAPRGDATSASAAPSFDIVRVEPSGEALLAGRSQPNDKVALVSGGKVVAEARADGGGNFVMTPPSFKPGDYALSLRVGQGAAAQDSKQSVVVSVPASKSQPVVVAMAEPGKATTVLSTPPQAEDFGEATPEASPTAPAAPVPAVPAPAPKLAISSVELENGSGLFASGTAPPGTDVRVYLNGSRVADVIAAAAGRWTVTVRRGLLAGRYAVRADSLKPDRSVDARVEVPFEVPAADLPAPDVRAPTAPTVPKVADAVAATPSPADVFVDELETELVSRGDNLWRISRKRLGHGTRYTEIYAANAAQIRDPKLVYPGQVFVLPHE